MAVMGRPRCEGWPIVEHIWRVIFRELELTVEGVDVSPVSQHALFFRGEIDASHVER